MNIILYIAVWALVGLWSFIFTQDIIGGWKEVRSTPEPHKLFISAMLLGPITTLVCFYTLHKYYKHKK